jgi:hypothetical protein
MKKFKNNMNHEFDNFLVILKLFKNRPYHLSKFLIENKAINPDFLKKINDNDTLSDMSVNGVSDKQLHFNSISDMNKYYSSIIDDLENLRRKKTKDELEIELNFKLKKSIEMEDYEEAARIRDYMKTNNLSKF